MVKPPPESKFAKKLIAERNAAIQENDRLEAALRDSRQFVESLTQHSTSIIFVFDLDRMANIYSNRNVGEFLGYSTKQVQAMGADLLSNMLHPDDLPRVVAHFVEFANKADGEVVEIEYRAQHVSGAWRWIWNREVVFKRHADGRPSQIMGTAHDITERKQAEEEGARLAAIVESSQDAVIGVTLDGTLVSWNAAAEHLYGYAASEIIGQHASVLIPPTERGYISAMTRAILRGAEGENLEVARLRKDGSQVYISLSFSPIRNITGDIVGIGAIGRNITAQKQAEEALRRSEETLRTVMEAAPIILYAADSEGTITLSQGTGFEQFCQSHEQIIGQSLFRIYRAAPEIMAHLCLALAGKSVSYDTEIDGRCYHNEVRPQRDSEGAVTGLIGVAHDITERKHAEIKSQEFAIVLEAQKAQLEQANAELAALATIDGLTGLRNRRAFDERLVEEFERASRYHKSLSLLMLDIDYFKQYNDTFGHPAGDEVLRKMAHILQKATRDTDFLARYGGEEIVIILPETDGDGAIQVAERVRSAITYAPWDKREITASLGVCTMSLTTAGPEELISAADLALYQSKADGRNRVTHERSLAEPQKEYAANSSETLSS